MTNTSILENLRECRDLIIESRLNLSKRDENYARIRELTEKLIEDYFQLDKTDTFMAIEVAGYQKSIKHLKLALASLTLAFAIALAIIFVN